MDTTRNFDVDVDPDDYATAAAQDTPTTSRGVQTEADFAAQKASYTAKFAEGNVSVFPSDSDPCHTRCLP